MGFFRYMFLEKTLMSQRTRGKANNYLCSFSQSTHKCKLIWNVPVNMLSLEATKIKIAEGLSLINTEPLIRLLELNVFQFIFAVINFRVLSEVPKFVMRTDLVCFLFPINLLDRHIKSSLRWKAYAMVCPSIAHFIYRKMRFAREYIIFFFPFFIHSFFLSCSFLFLFSFLFYIFFSENVDWYFSVEPPKWSDSNEYL